MTVYVGQPWRVAVRADAVVSKKTDDEPVEFANSLFDPEEPSGSPVASASQPQQFG